MTRSTMSSNAPSRRASKPFQNHKEPIRSPPGPGSRPNLKTMMASLRTPSAPTAVATVFARTSSALGPTRAVLSLPHSGAARPLLARLFSSEAASCRVLRPPRASLRMDSVVAAEAKATEKVEADGALPELVTEFMVDMKCNGCISAVKSKLLQLEGIKQVDADLDNQVVKIHGTSPVRAMVDALERTGRKARLIGQGNPDDFSISAAVAEFKDPIILGVVRLAQVSMELARIDASFTGLGPGRHGWAINQYGDLTEGPVSTGKVFNPVNQIRSSEPLGDLGTLDVQESGEAHFSGSKKMLKVADLIGRSVVVYGTEDKSDDGLAAAVIARSAGVGENYKKLCTCDGVTIWESS